MALRPASRSEDPSLVWFTVVEIVACRSLSKLSNGRGVLDEGSMVHGSSSMVPVLNATVDLFSVFRACRGCHPYVPIGSFLLAVHERSRSLLG